MFLSPSQVKSSRPSHLFPLPNLGGLEGRSSPNFAMHTFNLVVTVIYKIE